MATQDSTRGGKDHRRRGLKRQKSPPCNTKDRRVYLGPAFEKWHEVKAATGTRSDAELALNLLDKKKIKVASSPSASGAGAEKIRFSPSEVKALIEQEVHSTVKKNEMKLQGLIKELDFEDDFETSLQKLEARIDTITKRAEEAFACMKEMQKKQSHLPPVSEGTGTLDFKGEAMGTESHDEKTPRTMVKSEELFQELETSKKALKEMHMENEALKAAMADLTKEPPPPIPPPVLAPSGSSGSEGLAAIVKKALEGEEGGNVDGSKLCEEPKPRKGKEEFSTPAKSCKHSDSEQDKLLYPPLPSITFPSVLSTEAASYNVPQRPIVHLALIRKPPGLSVLWNVAEKDPLAPPMDSYSVYMAVEKVKGGGVFQNWRTIGVTSAVPPPMCVMVTKYKPGHKVRVAVVGKDKFGRYGPYSNVVTAAIPE